MTKIRDVIADYLWFARNIIATPRAHVPSRPNNTRATIVMLPGILEDGSYFQSTFEPLEKSGYDVVQPDLGRMLAPVPELARLVIADVAKRFGEDPDLPIILLAHSKGSLVGRATLAALPEGVHGLIAIAAPWSGSSMSNLFPWVKALASMAPKGPALAQPWGAVREHLLRSRIYSLSPTWDLHIPEGSQLEGATNIPLKVSGHFRGIGAPHTLDVVVSCIEELIDLGPIRTS